MPGAWGTCLLTGVRLSRSGHKTLHWNKNLFVFRCNIKWVSDRCFHISHLYQPLLLVSWGLSAVCLRDAILFVLSHLWACFHWRWFLSLSGGNIKHLSLLQIHILCVGSAFWICEILRWRKCADTKILTVTSAKLVEDEDRLSGFQYFPVWWGGEWESWLENEKMDDAADFNIIGFGLSTLLITLNSMKDMSSPTSPTQNLLERQQCIMEFTPPTLYIFPSVVLKCL